MSTTPRLALTRESWSTQVADALDRLTSLFEQHEHAGSGMVVPDPTSAPTVALGLANGGLLPDTDYYWKVSWADAFGGESVAGPEAHLHTPAGQDVPPAPLLTASAGGSLKPGINYWGLTAISAAGVETKLGPTNFNTIDPAARTMGLTWTYTDVTAGISVWRRGPFSGSWTRITTLAGGSTSYTDDGSIPDDSATLDRPPSGNSIVGQYSAVITLTESIPANATAWYLYATRQPGAYTTPALVHQIVETDTFDALLTAWTDAGSSRLARVPVAVNTSIGAPKAAAMLIGSDAARLAYPVSGLPDAVFYWTEDFMQTWVSQSGAWARVDGFLRDSGGTVWTLSVQTDGTLVTSS